jgi:hypothetical protein
MSMVWSFLTLGVQTFQRGFFEVDLMNYYNGQLWLRSANRPAGLALGWHIWSVLRGLGFLLLTYEVISLAMQCATGRELAPRSRRWKRWTAAAALLVADGLAKHWLLEPVRQGLYENLLS